ncbi:cytochrome P450 [Coniochaeta ligniaria NRRL 30616]|uniref:Cytochrome P450 n=1 Tax=Coniochaeta ligniaria NRRL 30616 TaxID=1408157 RepID=A0A1J7J1W4_9PEZI|nr:cytochrome P450 [Coniochaeta ligniaria NRRL 30616]
MAAQILEVVVERVPLIATTAIVSLLAFIIQRLFSKASLSHFPLAGAMIGDAEKRRKAYLAGAKSIYKEGYQKFKNSVFRVTSPRTYSDTVVVSPAFLPELKKLPDDVLSMSEAVAEQLEAKYTKINTDEPIVAHTVKASLTPGLVRLNHYIADEVDRTLRTELPPCKDWTEVNINSKLLRVVAIVSGRVFIGPELCHDEAYINAAVNYTIDVIQALQAVQRLTPWQRWLRGSSLPEVKNLDRHEEEATRFLRPIIAARRQAEKDQPGYQKPDDMLQWLMNERDFGEREDRELAKLQLTVSFAAIHTTTLTATNAFYNLAAHPQLVPELRQEIQTVLAEHGNQFTSPALQKMKKLDSFLKETLRLHPNAMVSFRRKVLKPITLSSGQVIPAGVMLEVPHYAISHDEETFPEPEKFDGLRFYRMREQSQTFNKPSAGGKATSVEAAAHNLFASVSQNSPTFGYGRHACPGRFFAANEIKMIVSRALLTYDIRNVGESTERYPNIEVSNLCFPDPTRKLLFKAV